MSSPQLIAIAALCLASGCVRSQTATEFAAPPPDAQPHAAVNLPICNFVVLDPEEAQSSFGFPYPKSPTWKPTNEQAVDALRKVPAYLENALQRRSTGSSYGHQLPGVIARLPQTLCQSVGIVIDEREAIFLNFIPRDDSNLESDFWRHNYVRFYDGGPRWWSINYFPDTEEFAKLRIDLGF